jgi:hypothetical protein
MTPDGHHELGQRSGIALETAGCARESRIFYSYIRALKPQLDNGVPTGSRVRLDDHWSEPTTLVGSSSMSPHADDRDADSHHLDDWRRLARSLLHRPKDASVSQEEGLTIPT